MRTTQSASARPDILTVSVFRLQMIVPIALALPIARRPRLGTAQRIHCLQPGLRQPVIKLVDYAYRPPDGAVPPLRQRLIVRSGLRNRVKGSV